MGLFLQRITLAPGYLRRLVGDLSTLTQVEAHELEIELQPLQPTVLLEQVYHTCQPIAARQGVDLSLDLPQNAPPILADEGRMLQVLKNLVENALRYTPVEGRITRSVIAGERVHLMVSDTRLGIDPEDLPYVFDRFYRSYKARGANTGKLGLGLEISKAQVMAQGGMISAQSGGNGQGAAMGITFDAAPAQTI